MRDYSNLHLASVQISYELEKVDRIYAPLYEEAYGSKILAILQFLKGKTDVVVFPELSIPFELLQQLKDFASKNSMMIVAGSHYTEYKNQETYLSLLDHPFQDFKPRKNICPIITLRGKMFHIEKAYPSKLEDVGFKEQGMKNGNIQSIFTIGNYNVGILICSDFDNPELRYRIASKSHLLIVPQYNNRMKRFYEIAQSEFSNPDNVLRCIFLSNANFSSGTEDGEESKKEEKVGSAIFRSFSRSDQKLLENEYGYPNAGLITDFETKEDIVVLTRINLSNNSERTPNVWSKDDHPLDYRLIPIIQKTEDLSRFAMLVEESADLQSCLKLNDENRELIKESSKLLFNKTESLDNLTLREIKELFEMILH